MWENRVVFPALIGGEPGGGGVDRGGVLTGGVDVFNIYGLGLLQTAVAEGVEIQLVSAGNPKLFFVAGILFQIGGDSGAGALQGTRLLGGGGTAQGQGGVG